MGECSLLNKLDLSSCVTMYMTFVMLFIYTFFFTCFVSQLHLLIQLPLTVTLMLSRLLPLDDENMGRVISGVHTYSHSLSFGQVHLRPWCSFCRTSVAPSPGLKFPFHIWSVFIFTQETSLDMGYFSQRRRYIRILYPTHPGIGYSCCRTLVLWFYKSVIPLTSRNRSK